MNNRPRRFRANQHKLTLLYNIKKKCFGRHFGTE